MPRLTEMTDGAILRMMRLFGLETSPLRPGEPLPSRRPAETPDAVLRQMEGTGLSKKLGTLFPNISRPELMDLLDEMDATGMASSIIDMMSEDAIQPNPDTGASVAVKAKGRLKTEIDNLFAVVNVEENLPRMSRGACKYGTDLRRLIYSTGRGVTMLVPTRARDMEIVTSKDTHETVGYKEEGRRFRDGKNEVSWAWDYLHTKLPSKDETDPYGTGVVTPGIRSWSQLNIAEDFALLYRVSRHPDRLKFRIDIGSMSEEDGLDLTQEFRRRMKKKTVVDPVRAQLKQEYNPWTVLEDIYLGVRPNSVTDVDMLPGSVNANDVTDLNYYRRKFLMECGIDPSLFGDQENNSGDDPIRRNKKLVNQDVRYARRIKKIQKALQQSLMRLVEIHLTLLQVGQNVENSSLDFLDDNGQPLFAIGLQPPSYLEELERLEVFQLRMQIANDRMAFMGQAAGTIEPLNWTRYVLREVLQLEEPQIRKLTQEPPKEPEDGGVVKNKSSRGRRAAAEHRTRLTTPLSDYADGDLSDPQVALLAEMLVRSPKLQRRIERMRLLLTDTPID